MKVAAKSTTEMSNEERKMLEILNQETKKLYAACCMGVPTTFLSDLDIAL